MWYACGQGVWQPEIVTSEKLYDSYFSWLSVKNAIVAVGLYWSLYQYNSGAVWPHVETHKEEITLRISCWRHSYQEETENDVNKRLHATL